MRNFKKCMIYAASYFAAFILFEIIFRIAAGAFSLNGGFAVAAAMAAFFSCGAALFAGAFSLRAGKNILTCALAATALSYIVQTVYYGIFGTYCRAFTLAHAAQASGYMAQALESAADGKFAIAGTVLVCAGAIYVIRRIKPEESHWGISFEHQRNELSLKGIDGWILSIGGALMAAAVVAAVLIVGFGARGLGSPHEYLFNVNSIEGVFRSAGLPTGSLLDIKRTVFGFDPPSGSREYEIADPVKAAGISESDFTDDDFETDGDADAKTAHEKYLDAVNELYSNCHIIPEISFASEDEESDAAEIDRYLGSRLPAAVNEKTGMFSNYNLILIIADGFTEAAIDSELTPTLYKLKTEGFDFKRFCTPMTETGSIDGEYSILTGLLPEAGRWSLTESAEKAMPYALGNLFRDAGYGTYAYTNANVKLYGRPEAYENFGYDFAGEGGALRFKETSPESDLEMAEKTAEYYLAADEKGTVGKFSVCYIMTSGSAPYDFELQDMAAKHRDETEYVSGSDGYKAYIAANTELDSAVSCLIDKLTAAGVLENTVIAVTGNHAPYGLEETDKNAGSLLLWASGTGKAEVRKVCSGIDVTPTLANLFGLDYDSRMFIGNDAFSPDETPAVNHAGEWIASGGDRRKITNKAYINRVDEEARDMVRISSLIRKTDYYGIIAERMKNG